MGVGQVEPLMIFKQNEYFKKGIYPNPSVNQRDVLIK